MKNIIKTTILISSASFLIACGGFGDDDFSTDINDVNFSSGDLDVTKYVAIGDSLTAGFADGTLYKSAQESSFPNILAQSFAQVGGGTFTQPLSDNLGGLVAGGNPISGFDVRLVLGDPGTGEISPVPQDVITTSVMRGNDITMTLPRPFNNLGVPGAKSFHLLASTYGDITGLLPTTDPATANPFYVRFRTSPTTSLVAEAAGQAPSFFTLWIGNNDILGFGRTGGDGSDPITPVTDTDMNSATPDFTSAYNGIVATLTAGGTNNVQGALINIPAITSIPFFTSASFDAILLDQATADQVNAGFTSYNNALDLAVAGAFAGLGITMTQEEADQRRINFAAGQNGVLILDETLTDLTPANADLLNFRQAVEGELILLTAAARLGTRSDPNDAATTFGVSVPLTDADFLTNSEVDEINVARDAYNAVILAAANANDNLIHIDVAALLADVADGGINYGSGSVTSVFATGGAFSLDGIHPTAKGHAIVANFIMDSLNENFNANLPRVNPNNFTEIFFAFPDSFDFSQ